MANRKAVKPKSFEGIYKRLEEVILANSGENEFEEIIKLVILKLWNEMHNEVYEKELKEANKKLKVINNKWKGVLGGTFFNITDEQYSICMAILNKISFLETGYEGIDSVFEFLISREKKGAKGQYFTPRYLVDFCVKIINPKVGEVVLDPAAGSGAFLYHTYISNPDIMPKDLWGFDFDHIAIRVAKLLMYVTKLNDSHIYQVNSLIKNNKAAEGENITTIEDIMRIEKQKGLFDVIMTNPPFAGEITEVEILRSYIVSKDKTRIEREVLFIERCIDLLKPNGRMSIVLPDNIFGGKDTAELRKWINEQCRIVGVVGIPRNTFMPHTSVKTSILFLQKREKKEKIEEKIFFGISERAGKDNRGNIQYKNENHVWTEVDHDLDEIRDTFYSFIKEERIGW
ncbi:MAG: SAM-dependent methyltransferase [Eubacterium sp.]|nr:SAM-dependent methyltransferase [Eubacterium sp.]